MGLGQPCIHVFLAPSGALVVTLSVCLSGTSLSRALNLHLSLIDLSQVSLSFPVSLRSVSGYSQVILRSVSGLSVITSSDRRSLKYFVLLSMI